MMRIIPDLLGLLQRFVPPWLLIALAVVLAPIAVMAWLRWVRAKQIRGALRTAFLATDPNKRRQAIDHAFDLAGEREQALIALTDTAHRTGLVDVTTRGLAALESRGMGAHDVARIRAATAKPPRRAGHPVEEVVVIERFLEQDMIPAATERLNEALQRFPDDPELRELRDTIRSRTAPSE